jgi:hypothetical protein
MRRRAINNFDAGPYAGPNLTPDERRTNAGHVGLCGFYAGRTPDERRQTDLGNPLGFPGSGVPSDGHVTGARGRDPGMVVDDEQTQPTTANLILDRVRDEAFSRVEPHQAERLPHESPHNLTERPADGAATGTPGPAPPGRRPRSTTEVR